MASIPNTSPSHARSAGEIRWVSLLLILLQLGLFLVILYVYDLESRAFLHLGINVFFAFIVHYFLPRPLQRPFFAVVSLFCLATVFGFQLEQWSLPGLQQAAWIAGLGLGVIGICHLPAPFAVRVGLLLAAAIVLTAMRAGAAPAPWSASIWPVFASMFMFRTALYMHAMKYDKQPPTLLDALCYFFMLPNPCFPLFPVVDIQTFRRTYFDAPDRHQIYQTGVTWLFRGATHLILYRLVYHNLVISAADVTSIPKLLQFLVWPFLLYLRISGQFHIITGMLHLFGFNLPETHRLYFLSSSFTDFWRRINIYWKDFMMKLFFYPTYVRLKRLGPTAALVTSMIIVFTATWLLHAYQWFWIRGSWLFTWNDSLFWAILAALVIVNALYETTHGRRRSLSPVRTSWRDAARTGLKAAAMFATICVLWSFWSAESVTEWASAFRVLRPGSSQQGWAGAAWLLALGLSIAVPATLLALNPRGILFRTTRSAAAVTIGSLLVLGLQAKVTRNSLDVATRSVVTMLAKSDLNRRDFAEMQRGYYENLLDVAQFNPELLEVYRTRPADWVFALGGEAFENVARPPYFVLRANFEGRALGEPFQTNSWGMRDQEYARERPQGVTRIALVGASFVMGAGVELNRTFQAVLENRLNAGTEGDAGRFEVLNFGVGGYTQIQQVGLVENHVFDFSPQLVIYIEHGDPFVPTAMGLVNVFRNGRYQDYDFLVEVAKKANVGRDMDPVVIDQRIQPYKESLLLGIYRRIAAACRAHDATAVWLYVPRPETWDRGPSDFEMRLAREAGFHVLILDNVYTSDSMSPLWLARWDHHPNALGHQMIADRMYEVLTESGLLNRGDTLPAVNVADDGH